MRDDTCDLLLDSTTLTGTTTREMSSEGETTCDNSMVDLSQLRGKTHCHYYHSSYLFRDSDVIE